MLGTSAPARVHTAFAGHCSPYHSKGNAVTELKHAHSAATAVLCPPLTAAIFPLLTCVSLKHQVLLT